MSNSPATTSPQPLRLAQRAYDYAQLDVFAEQPLDGNAARHLHRRARPLHRRDAGASPARPISARPPSSCPRDPRSSASAASTSASSPFGKSSSSPAIPRSAPRAGSTATTPLFAAPRPSRSISASAPSLSASRHRSPASAASSAPCARTIPPSAQIHDRAQIAAALDLSLEDLDPASPHPDRLHRHGLLHRAAALARSRRAPRHPAARCSRLPRTAATQNSSTASRAPTHDSGADWHARMQFYNGEDPATGSASGCTIAYLVQHGLAASEPAHRHRAGHRDASSQPHPRPGANSHNGSRHKCVRRWPHHSRCKRTLFPAVMHAISTATAFIESLTFMRL